MIGLLTLSLYDPAFVARVVRRVDVDALHLPGVVRKQRLERNEVVALDDEVAVARLPAGAAPARP